MEVLSFTLTPGTGGPGQSMNTSVERRHVLLSHQFPGAEPGPCLSAYCSQSGKLSCRLDTPHPRSKEPFLKEVSVQNQRGGARIHEGSLGHLLGGQLHRFCFVSEVPTCRCQQATGIACPRGGTPAQTRLALRSRAECWAGSARSLAGGGSPTAAEQPL